MEMERYRRQEQISLQQLKKIMVRMFRGGNCNKGWTQFSTLINMEQNIPKRLFLPRQKM